MRKYNYGVIDAALEEYRKAQCPKTYKEHGS